MIAHGCEAAIGRAGTVLRAAALPAAFVFLWSTGFIGARLGLPYAEPLTFLTLRFVIAAALLAMLALLTRAPWPRRTSEVGRAAMTGLLVHGVYLGGVFVGIGLGVEAGVSSLIVSTQPLVVAAVSGVFLGEPLARRQWLGMALGLGGVALVLGQKLGHGTGPIGGVVACLTALLGISAGTLYQKRHGAQVDLVTGNVVQYLAAASLCGLGAAIFEHGRLDWTPALIVALAWLVLALSLGAVSLLYLLIRRGAAASVSSLFFLVPPVTALLGWLIFGETLAPPALLGLAVTVAGVALVMRHR